MSSPRYFFAMFGNPHPPGRDTIESGVYHPHPNCAPFPAEPGDVLLLYCTKKYTDHSMQVPGLGIVLHVDSQVVRYRYVPLSEPIPKKEMEQNFLPIDLAKFGNRRFYRFWLFEISKDSFDKVVGDQAIV